MSENAGTTGQGSPAAAASGRPRVLVVGGKVRQLRKARELGLDVLHAQYPNAYGSEHWPYVGQALLLDYSDVDQVLPMARALHARYPFRTAVTLTEFGLLPAARINEELGLAGESVETVELLLDKARMRQCLAEKGLSPVASAVGRTTQDVRDFVAAHGLPIIVKPVRESGSLAVFCVREEAEVDAVAEKYRSLNDKDWAQGDVAFADTFQEFLMEEYLEGPLFSVETLSFDGRHVVVATTGRELGGSGFADFGTTGFAEIGLSMPAPIRPRRCVRRPGWCSTSWTRWGCATAPGTPRSS
ncbi:ATP-grasp domain-containing protein [Streptomyces roseicoloratus]|uniref:ATP-grasp domain-containing protein n=1 Tax=Streptomyces roseicoloratus TaxID=2508722 RepID=A0ABY9S5N6_9ACTN|nr:ATP-grasp domain-containing protein [Streptomyces roseicoloratus]WMX48300.1 ATP-grasp domain-containing protein [Streptomyces roseicoloratus]